MISGRRRPGSSRSIAETIMTEFKGKIALVTGTSAIRLASSGATVLACGNDVATNEIFDRIAKERDLPMSTRLTDVAVEAEVEAAVREAVLRHGGLDIIVNAAAVHPYGTVLDTSAETF